MRRLSFNISGHIAVYILVFPVIFGYHASDHKQDVTNADLNQEIPEGGIIDQDDPNCTLCYLFQNQTAVIDRYLSYSHDTFLNDVPGNLLKKYVYTSTGLLCLRGPPACRSFG